MNRKKGELSGERVSVGQYKVDEEYSSSLGGQLVCTGPSREVVDVSITLLVDVSRKLTPPSN